MILGNQNVIDFPKKFLGMMEGSRSCLVQVCTFIQNLETGQVRKLREEMVLVTQA